MTLVSRTTRIIWTGRLQVSSGAAGGGDFGVDLAHGHLMEAFAFGFRPNLFQPIRRGRDCVDAVLDAHDDDGGLAAPIHQETFILLAGAANYLTELSPGSQPRTQH